MFIKITQNNFRTFSTFQLNEDTHTLAVRFITQIRNSLQLFMTYQISDFFQQNRLIDHKRQFGNNNQISPVFGLFKMTFCPYPDYPASRCICVIDSTFTDDRSPGWKIRSRNKLHQILNCRIFTIIQIIKQGIHYLS